MGCCNQAPKGGTGKLSYLFGVMIIMFIVIFMIAALWG
ncbi:membrane protein [Vibrio diabolicus]|nr:membrane protein [Vibrio diabolicus]